MVFRSFFHVSLGIAMIATLLSAVLAVLLTFLFLCTAGSAIASLTGR
jgi:hypothetical protein